MYNISSIKDSRWFQPLC